MTNAIAPVGTAVASMGRHGNRSFEGQREHDQPQRDPDNAPVTPERVAAPPPPTEDDPHAVMPGALFAATLMAQDLPQTPAALRPQLLAAQGWTPPQSSLRLKDAIA